MTAAHPGEPPALPRPACTPAAIRAVLAAHSDADTVRRYDADLDAAFEQARRGGDPTLLRLSAAGGTRRTPGATPPRTASTWPASTTTSPTDRHPRRSGSAVRRSANGTASDPVFRWELDEPADCECAGLDEDARKALGDFMDTVVIVSTLPSTSASPTLLSPPRC